MCVLQTEGKDKGKYKCAGGNTGGVEEDEINDETICDPVDVPQDKDKCFDDCVVTEFNSEFSYDLFSNNCRHFADNTIRKCKKKCK